MAPQARYKAKLKRLGLCYNCGKPPRAGFKSCARCAAHFRQRALQGDRAKARERRQRWNQKNPQALRTAIRNWVVANRPRVLQNQRQWRQQTHGIPRYFIERRLRARLLKKLKAARVKKNIGTWELVGCSPQHLIEHLEKQFTQGMTWDNHGKWHVDHIVPCARFDLTDTEQQRRCFHFTNLQPLWASDNLKKWAS